MAEGRVRKWWQTSDSIRRDSASASSSMMSRMDAITPFSPLLAYASVDVDLDVETEKIKNAQS
jgi:hypothetical protein